MGRLRSWTLRSKGHSDAWELQDSASAARAAATASSSPSSRRANCQVLPCAFATVRPNHGAKQSSKALWCAVCLASACSQVPEVSLLSFLPQAAQDA